MCILFSYSIGLIDIANDDLREFSYLTEIWHLYKTVT